MQNVFPEPGDPGDRRTRREEAEKKLEEERLQEEARQQAQRAREIVEGQKAGQGTEPENGGKA